MEIMWEEYGDVLVVKLSDSLDVGAGSLLQQADCFVNPELDMVVDLSDLDYIDSSGLGALVRVMKQVKQSGRKIVLAEPNLLVGRVLSVTAIDQVFPTTDTVEEALQVIEKQKS